MFNGSAFYTGLGSCGKERYFTFFSLFFIASFLILPTSKMVNNVFYVFLAIPALYFLTHAKNEIKRNLPSLSLFFIFLLWMVVQGFLSGDGQFFRHILYVFLFLMILSVLINPRPFYDGRFARMLFWMVCIYITGSAVAYWLTGAYGVGDRVIWLPSRMNGPIYSSMWLAACLALAAPTWVREHRWVEAAAALIMTLFCIVFVLQSRSGLVGIVLLMVGLSATTILRNIRRTLLFLLFFSVVGLGIWSFREAPGLERVFTARNNRFDVWSPVYNDWRSCGLLLGCGVDYECQDVTSKARPIAHPHNIYLSLGVYGGGVSLLLFLAWMAQLLIAAFSRQNPWGLYLFVSLCMLHFDGGLIVNNPDPVWLLVFLPAGLICADLLRAVSTAKHHSDLAPPDIKGSLYGDSHE